MFFNWLSRTPRGVAKRSQESPRRFRPGIETLERRETPASGSPVGALDPTFDQDGIAITSFNLGSGTSQDDEAFAVATQADGKIVVAGRAVVAAQADFAVVRYDRDGSLDETFEGNGKVLIPFDLGGDNRDTATAVAILPTGKILVSGFVSTGTLSGAFAICRLNSDGSLDNTFSGDGKFTVDFNGSGFLTAMTVQADGKIILAGGARTSASTLDFAVCRLKPNGGLDTTFGAGGKVTVDFNLSDVDAQVAAAVALAPGGKIVVAGTSAFLGGAPNRVLVCRLTPSGALDSSFSGDGRFDFTFSAPPPGSPPGNHFAGGVAVQPNGRIIVVGDASGDTGIARLTSSGAFDNSFDGDGTRVIPIGADGLSDFARAVVLQPDGKIVIAGGAAVNQGGTQHRDIYVLRLHANGSSDTTFGAKGSGVGSFDLAGASDDSPSGVALSSDGIIVAGSVRTAEGLDFAALRVHRDDWVVVGQDRGGSSVVKVLTPTGTPLFGIKAMPTRFKGGIRVATTHLNEDGVPEIITAPGPGGKAVVKIFDGFTRRLIRAIKVHPKFEGGLNIAVGNVLPDGVLVDHRLELLVAFDKGGRPDVLVFDPDSGARLQTLRVYNAKFRGGVRLALGKFTPGMTEFEQLYVTPGPGGPTVAKVFDVAAATLLQSIRVFGGNQGAFIATAFLSGSADRLIVGGGAAPVVKVFDADGTLVSQYTLFPRSFKGGVRVATAQLQGGGSPEIIAAPGPDGAVVKVLDIDGNLISQFRPFGRKAKTGFFVAAGLRAIG
jgi:uncharacterized delta-60 repeat protein